MDVDSLISPPWLDDRARDAVEARGADAVTYLHSQLSQDIAGMGDGDVRWSFVLQPTGKVEALVRVSRLAADLFVLDVDAGYAEPLLARLNRFRIRVDVTFSIARLGQPDTDAARQRERVLAVWPRMGAEIVPGETIPAETGATVVGAAVSFTKGCYPGQELVERMDSRGATAPRVLRCVTVTGTEAPGDDLLRDGAVIGRLTTVQGDVALALVNRAFADELD